MSETRRKSRARWILAGLLLLGAVPVVAVVASRHTGSGLSSEWPRPYDPAKPFNMLGVPGVSVEQRERAEDLLLRSLTEAHRWGEYQAALDAGWYSIETPRPGGFEHLVNPRMIDDGYMLDPTRPESLVYKVKGDERIFVAYMFMAAPGVRLGDASIAEFAGRLIEWHIHEDVCILPVEGNLIGNVAGFAQEDGTCDVAGAAPRTLDLRTLTGDVPEGTTTDGLELAMTHVWVVARECGPFSTLAGPAQGDTLTPRDERVDLCRH
ncbi:MAG: hypothetical protein KJS90_08450 [Acidobacteria bacterium]|nr:hypothetical protein [Acidobacteriota bacterium]